MRVTSRGQVTTPSAMREAAGLLPGTEVDVVLEPDGVRIVKAGAARWATRGADAVERLRRHTPAATMSTDQILALMRGA